MSLRTNLVYTYAWQQGAGTNKLPAYTDNEDDARANLQCQHTQARDKINEIVGAIQTSMPANPDNDHLLTAKAVADAMPEQAQADWNQSDDTAPDYIKNKPTIPAEVTIDGAISTVSENPVQNKVIYQAFLDMIYPVGSIYMSTQSTSPATFLGGTWTQIKDTFLLAAGDTYAAGATGGSATAALPQHKHKYDNIYIEPATVQKNQSGEWVLVYDTGAAGGELSAKQNGSTRNEGSGSDPISTMPPYKVVYAWERTA